MDRLDYERCLPDHNILCLQSLIYTNYGHNALVVFESVLEFNYTINGLKGLKTIDIRVTDHMTTRKDVVLCIHNDSGP